MDHNNGHVWGATPGGKPSATLRLLPACSTSYMAWRVGRVSARPLELGTGERGWRRLVQSTCGWIITPCYKVAATSDPPL